MLDLTAALMVAGTFFLAGTVKGVIGLGLPTVSLALLTVATDLTTAMVLLLVPSFVTNVWQALVGGNAATVLKRLWSFIVMAAVTVWVGVAALTRLDTYLLTAVLGVLLVTYAVVNLGGLKLKIPAQHEIWAAPIVGTANGVLTGMTGSFVVPGVMFLQAIGLSRDVLIQAMGMLFTVSTLALAVALHQADMLTVQHGTLSFAAVIPAIAGMIAGQKIRTRLSEQTFRTVFFSALLVLGAYIIVNALDARG